MHLRYIYHGKNNEAHPSLVKFGWIPPVQRSVRLESCLEATRVLLVYNSHSLETICLTVNRENLKHLEKTSK